MYDNFTGGMGILQPTNIGVEMDKLAVKKKSGAFWDILEYVKNGINTTASDPVNGTNDISFTKNENKKTVKILTIKGSAQEGFSLSKDTKTDVLFFKENEKGNIEIYNKKFNVVLVEQKDIKNLDINDGKLWGMPDGRKLDQNSFNNFFSEQGE